MGDKERSFDSADLIAGLEKYDITAERKSMYSDIEHLIEFGYDIVLTRHPSAVDCLPPESLKYQRFDY